MKEKLRRALGEMVIYICLQCRNANDRGADQREAEYVFYFETS